MKWNKHGQIFAVHEHRKPWMWSHAQNPSPVVLKDRIRIFFNTRPESRGGLSESHPAYVDVELQNPSRVIGVSSEPVLTLGDIGCFDQHGCMTGSVVRKNDEFWMYYVGWTRCVDVPYNWAIGLAVSQDGGGHFERMFRGPVIGSQYNEPYLQNGQFVLRTNEHEWHMWYSTGAEWIKSGTKAESRYVVVHATSGDGVRWERNGKPLLPFVLEDETQTTPAVFKLQDRYHMYFSYRHSTSFRNAERGYRIGYAWSEDMNIWHRDDSLAGMGVSTTGWDSEMVCYPNVCAVGDQLYVFYCGNDFGRNGFGYAVLASDG
ncbi:MAG: hypothetical protein NT105_21040 [Verrucomicrobia bacterium]|nr:hypothetical protein [Verrucomicrobiota bacterium]